MESGYAFPTLHGFITGAMIIGLAIGSLIGGAFAKFGKRNCINVANVALSVGTCISIVDRSISQILVGRLLWGAGAGAHAVLIPSYINELSPPEYKGPLACSF